MTGDNGHVQDDVMYIALPGCTEDTVHKPANWAAQSYDDFEASITGMGNELVKNLF